MQTRGEGMAEFCLRREQVAGIARPAGEVQMENDRRRAAGSGGNGRQRAAPRAGTPTRRYTIPPTTGEVTPNASKTSRTTQHKRNAAAAR